MSLQADERAEARARRWAVPSVVLLTAIGALMRLLTITQRSYWLDEAISIKQANQPALEVIRDMATGVHPPLYHFTLHFWVQLFGISELAVRSYSAMWGIAAIPVAYWAGYNIFESRRTGLIAALLTTVSPLFIWYSQEARMYSLMMFFGMLSIGAMARAMRVNTVWSWVLFGIATFGGLFTHYFFAFLALGEALYYIFAVVVHTEIQRRRAGEPSASLKNLKRLWEDIPTFRYAFNAALILGGSYVLWLSRSVFLPDKSGTGGVVSAAAASGLGYGQSAPKIALRFNDSVMVVVQSLLGIHADWLMYAFVATWPLIISAILVSFDFMRPMAKRAPLVLWTSGGLLILIALGQWQGQVLAVRYFIAVLASLTLLIAGMIGMIDAKHGRWLLALVVAVSIVAWADQSFNHDNMLRFDNREAVAEIVDGYKPGDIVIYDPFYMAPLINYYLPDSIPTYPFPMYGPYAQLRSAKNQIYQDLDRVAKPVDRVWLLMSFQDIPSNRDDAYNIRMWMLRNGFEMTRSSEYNRVQLFLYTNTEPGLGFPVGGAK